MYLTLKIKNAFHDPTKAESTKMSVVDESKHTRDPHRRPPQPVKTLYKKYQRASSAAIDNDPEILDLRHLDRIYIGGENGKLKIVDHIRSEIIQTACASFGSHGIDQSRFQDADMPCYESQTVPGTYEMAYMRLHVLTNQGFS